jgi:hypothetical protein
MFYPLGPCPIGITSVKGSVGNRFSYNDGNHLLPLFEHLINEVEHLYVRFNGEPSTEIGKGVEEGGVLAADENGNHIPSVFSRLTDKALLPRQIPDFSALSPGTQPCWKMDDCLLRGKGVIIGL